MVRAIDVDAAAIAAAIAEHEAQGAAIAAAVAAFDKAQLWELDGSTSMVGWLKDRCRLSAVEARRMVTRASRVDRLPVVFEAWSSGELSTAQVDLLVTEAGRASDVFEQNESLLVSAVAGLGVHETKVAMRSWRERVDAYDDRYRHEPDRHVRVSRTPDGYRVDGNLTEDLGEKLECALRVFGTFDADDARNPGERRHDALADIVSFALAHHDQPATPRNRPHVTVIVDAEQLRPDASHCDATVNRVVMEGASRIVDLGRSTRTVPAHLWRAVEARDRGCRFPGCDRPPAWCEAHHAIPWEHGGPTNPDNLVLLCARHHHTVHKPGWHATLLPDATLQVTGPTRTTRTTRPPGALAPAA